MSRDFYPCRSSIGTGKVAPNTAMNGLPVLGVHRNAILRPVASATTASS